MDKPEDQRNTEGQVSPLTLTGGTEPSLGSFFKQASGPTKFKLVSVFVLAVGVVATSSWIVVGLVRVQFGRAAGSRELASPTLPSAAVPAEKLSYAYEMNQIALGFSDRDRRRAGHAQFSLVLELPDAESRQWMELHRAQILDRIFEVGSTLTLEDFETPKGLEKLRGALRDRFVADFGAHAPQKIIFKDWVLQ